MAAYLTVEEFRKLTIMPSAYVDELEASDPEWLGAQLAYWSSMIDAQLRKRYAAPFEEPYPEAVTGWLARLVTLRAFLKRGIDPTDEQYLTIKEDFDAAKAEIKEAADADIGLYDLPLRADTTATGISKGGPFGYSEQSPYVWQDGQAEVGRSEDASGGGTGV